MGYRIETTEEYNEWESEQFDKARAQIAKRIANIENFEHFGEAKQLGDGVAELKFKSGTRIYFAIKKANDKTIILLLGGNKNGQSKDIKKAKSLLNK